MATATVPKKGKSRGKDKEPTSLNDKFDAQLSSIGIGGSLRLADEFDNDVKCHSTGFPGLDRAISETNPENQGLPECRHSEWYSKQTHVGKTSVALGIAETYQLNHKKRVGIFDIEESITTEYLIKTHRFVIDSEEADEKGLYALRLLQPQVLYEKATTQMYYAEFVLDLLAKAMNYFDLLIVDTVDALVSEADAMKDADQNDRTGGISKLLRSFFRKNTTRRAHTMFLNHANQSIGASMPGIGPTYTTSGGKSIPRYSSLRAELSQIERLKDNDKADPYGFKTRIQFVKNRLGPNWRYTDLTYIFGEGFSKDYAYFDTALQLGIIQRQPKGAWHWIGDENNPMLKAQGKMKTYKALKEDPKAFEYVKSLIDGEDVAPEVGVQQGDEAAVQAAETE
jgi:RecA/RadA recombinase